MVTTKAPKISFKAQMLQAREQALIDVVNRLLAEKGFEAMTGDEGAAEGHCQGQPVQTLPLQRRPGRRRHGALDEQSPGLCRGHAARAERAKQAARHGGMDHAAQAGR